MLLADELNPNITFISGCHNYPVSSQFLVRKPHLCGALFSKMLIRNTQEKSKSLNRTKKRGSKAEARAWVCKWIEGVVTFLSNKKAHLFSFRL